jgi:hypothetical protein
MREEKDRKMSAGEGESGRGIGIWDTGGELKKERRL